MGKRRLFRTFVCAILIFAGILLIFVLVGPVGRTSVGDFAGDWTPGKSPILPKSPLSEISPDHPRDVELLEESGAICGDRGGSDQEVLLLILITSHAAHGALRAEIRKSVPPADLQRLKLRRGFLLGTTMIPGRDEQKMMMTINSSRFAGAPEGIDAEQRHNSDLIVGNFQESYRNLTTKHMMGLQWAARFCPQAQFVLKQDDDVLVDYYQLAELLSDDGGGGRKLSSRIGEPLTWSSDTARSSGRDFILGKPLVGMPVIRDGQSKWFVQPGEFGGDIYPDFVSGWAYLTTIPGIQNLLSCATATDVAAGYFWIDDVFVTGILRECAGLPILDMSRIFTQYKGHLLCCLGPFAAAAGGSAQVHTNWRNYWCDFVAGPSNDDLRLLGKFYEHARECSLSKSCTWRRAEAELNRTCVITPHSYSKVLLPSGTLRKRGSWRVVSL